MRRGFAGTLVLVITAAVGCGGGSGTTSVLHKLPITVNTEELVNCTTQLGMTGVRVTNAGGGGHKARLIGGHGPSGAPIGIAFVPNRSFAHRLARFMAATYEVSLGPSATTIVFTDRSATEQDRQIVERCVAPNRY